MPGGAGARTITAQCFVKRGIPAVRPQLAPGDYFVRGYHFLLASLLNSEGAAIRDHKRGIAAADRLAPKRLQASGGPRREDRHLIVVAIPAGPKGVAPGGARRIR